MKEKDGIIRPGKSESETFDMNIEGFDVELQGLAGVASNLSMTNLRTPDLDSEFVELVKMSRRYLHLLIGKAIERHGGKIENAEIHSV
jgi:hypothetical protein